MKQLCTIAVLSASLSFAAGLPGHSISGSYMEARTADTYTGPCFANGEVDINGKEAVFGWKINNGSWKGVSLKGLGIVGIVRTAHTLGDIHYASNPSHAVLIVDSRADAAQRDALVDFARTQAPAVLSDVVKVTAAPIDLEIENGNIHGGAARLTAGSLAEIRTRGLTEADHICGNEDVFYPPLTSLQHAMPAYALETSYQGDSLNERFDVRFRRSAFLGTFQVPGE
ncbi:MAG: DUF1326 domain-containing protein [Acidobacteriota bacterium]|nr:DUF1326 domain-containing protein [Acidobacteriota bacterium]